MKIKLFNSIYSEMQHKYDKIMGNNSMLTSFLIEGVNINKLYIKIISEYKAAKEYMKAEKSKSIECI